MSGNRLFPGGIHPREGVNGKAVNGANAIQVLPPPPRVIIPLSQHLGAPAKATVKKGDHVKIGQVIGEASGFISTNVHASVSGTVVAVQNCIVGNGLQVPAVIINNDYQEEWVELSPVAHPETMSADELAKVVNDAGIAGLGGAVFPTHVKVKSKAEILIINGAECEPYLTADHRLMLEKASEIIDGLHIMMLAMGVKRAVIGIENNKPDAIAAMREAAQGVDGIEVKGLPVRYPQGGEKQLVYAITRRKVPQGGLPADIGCVVDNVGTVYAIQQAVRLGKPLIERVSTVGGLVKNPGNFLVRLGTPVENLIEACGGLQPEVRQFIYGGPMMGSAISRTDIPVTKRCSGLVALGEEAMEPKESACIHCGRCMRVCPMQLVPFQLDSLVRNDRFEDAQKAGIMSCMECGACTFACPAKRSLTQAFRTGKTVINTRRKKEAAKKAAAEKKEA